MKRFTLQQQYADRSDTFFDLGQRGNVALATGFMDLTVSSVSETSSTRYKLQHIRLEDLMEFRRLLSRECLSIRYIKIRGYSVDYLRKELVLDIDTGGKRMPVTIEADGVAVQTVQIQTSGSDRIRFIQLNAAAIAARDRIELRFGVLPESPSVVKQPDCCSYHKLHGMDNRPCVGIFREKCGVKYEEFIKV